MALTSPGQYDLHRERLPVREAGARQGRAEVPRSPRVAAGAGWPTPRRQLGGEVAGDSAPAEVPAQREGEDTAGLRWAPDTAPMKRITASTVIAGAVTAAVRSIWPWLAMHHSGAGAGEHEQERPQHLREQPSILQPRIVEVFAVAELQLQQVVRPRGERHAGDVRSRGPRRRERERGLWACRSFWLSLVRLSAARCRGRDRRARAGRRRAPVRPPRASS